jgi:hypothetical protein
MGQSPPRRSLPGAVTPNCGPPTPFCLWPVSVTSRRNRSGRCCVALRCNRVNRHPGSSPLGWCHTAVDKSEGEESARCNRAGPRSYPRGPTKVSRENQDPRQRAPARCRGTRTRRDRIASNGAARLPGVCFWSRCLGPPDVWDMRHSNLYRPDWFPRPPYASLAPLGPCRTLPGPILTGWRIPMLAEGSRRIYSDICQQTSNNIHYRTTPHAGGVAPAAVPQFV